MYPYAPKYLKPYFLSYKEKEYEVIIPQRFLGMQLTMHAHAQPLDSSFFA